MRLTSRLIYRGLLPCTCLCAMTLLDVGAAETVSISIDPAKAHAFSKDIFGVNALFNTRPINYDHPDLARKFVDLGATTIRYPGGTPANFYNFKTGYHDVDDRSEKHRVQMSNANKNTKSAKGDVGGYRTENFIKFIENSGAEFTLVLNVCTQDAAYTRDWMRLFKENGVAPKYVEIGNEVYFGIYGVFVKDVHDYIAKGKAHAAAVREVFPDTKIVAVISSHSFTDDTYIDVVADGKKKDRNHTWDSEIAKAGFYDMVVVHLYGSPGVDAKVKAEDIPDYLTIYTNCVSHVDFQTDATTDYLRRTFPGRGLAVTEWHVGGFGGDMRKVRLRYSHLGALYANNFFLELMKNPDIVLASKHSYAQMVTLTQDPKRGRAASKYYDDDLGVTANYLGMRLFKEAVRECDRYVPCDITGGATYKGVGKYKGDFPQLNAGAFLGDGEGYLFVVNKFDTPATLGSVTIPGSKTTVESVILMSPPKTEKSIEDEAINVEEVARKAGQPIDIPPYSMLKIKLTSAR